MPLITSLELKTLDFIQSINRERTGARPKYNKYIQKGQRKEILISLVLLHITVYYYYFSFTNGTLVTALTLLSFFHLYIILIQRLIFKFWHNEYLENERLGSWLANSNVSTSSFRVYWLVKKIVKDSKIHAVYWLFDTPDFICSCLCACVFVF